MSRYAWPQAPGSDESRDDPGARARYAERRRTDFDVEGALAAGRLIAPSRTARPGDAPMAPATGRAHLWQPLGPATVIGGQAIGNPRITGRVNALAVDNDGTDDGERLYAASGNGGVWYSSDGGEHWRSLGGLAETNRPEITRPAHRHATGAIHVEFGATEGDDVVFVGTGETTRVPRGQPGGTLGGIGILVATGPASSTLDDPWQREAPNLIGAGVNRFAKQPGGTTIVAATTIGLLQRPASPTADDDWESVSGIPFATLTVECTDVLWTAGAGTRPERLWVWVRRGAQAGLWCRDAGAADFKLIATPGAGTTRTVLAASTPPTQIFVLIDQGTTGANVAIPPLLFRVTSAATAPVAAPVASVPSVLGRQGFYDIGMTVHPTNPDRVVLVGNTFDTTAPDGTALNNDGAIVVGDVGLVAGTLTFGTPTAAQMIGVGAHADVHDVKYSNGGARLWVACDGGVYRSDNPTSTVGFRPCNNELSIVESNYVAGHPTCEGFVVTGLQDNALITRRSGTVWESRRVGDGGGVVFDATDPRRFLRQHFNGLWSESAGPEDGRHPLQRPAVWARAESDASAFYSEAAGIGHHRSNVRPAPPDVSQILIGTTRVWYTENFGTNWVTLPTGTDPLPANIMQDAFGEAVTVCRWQSPDVAWILGEQTLRRFARTPGSDAGGGPGTWTSNSVVFAPLDRKKEPEPAETMLRSSVWTDVMPNLDPPAGPGQAPVQHGTNGAVYIGTIGKSDDDDVDTLYWFDGTDKLRGTGLRNDADGVPAPVTAIACDPATPNEVWVGTTVGVWHGVRTDGDPPTWAWTALVNGLPEAAVEDLEIFSDDGLRLLRAAIASRGLWELRLDQSDVEDLVYVRAHDDDLRHRTRAGGLQRDLVTARSWHGSPDVRPRVRSAPLAAPGTLSWRRGRFDPDGLRRFQSALRSRSGDLRVRATGTWDDYFNEVLRDLGAPTNATGRVRVDRAFWNAQQADPADAAANPWGLADSVPTEEDLLELTPPLTEGELAETSCRMRRVETQVDVVVHRRGLGPVTGSDVRVTLLRWIDPRPRNRARWNDPTTWFSGDVPWTAAVNEVLNATSATTTQTFADGWEFVGSNATTRRRSLTGQTLDPMRSGIATFDLDLRGLRRNTVVLLVAIVRTAPVDSALAPASLQDLALTSPFVAVRSVRAR